jgi:hypothetical protein
MWIHFFFDFILPTTTETYYLIKDFITNLVLFIGVPMTIITGHDNMEQYIRQHVTDDSVYKCVSWARHKFTRRNLSRFVRSTQNALKIFFVNMRGVTTFTPVQSLESVTVVNKAIKNGNNSISPFPNLSDKNNPERILHI